MVDLWGQVPVDWQVLMGSTKEALSQISKQLENEIANGLSINPVPEKIFRALEVKPTDVKAIIIGQDPYPDSAFALGRAFGVPNEVTKLPASLRNIFKEVESDLGERSAANPDLQEWSDQGVLLLNKSLTTTAGIRNSHTHFNWEIVTRNIVRAVTRVNPEVVAILWGADAQQFADEFASNQVISSAHPSPLSAHRGFVGSKPFSRANEMLVRQGKEPIAW